MNSATPLLLTAGEQIRFNRLGMRIRFQLALAALAGLAIVRLLNFPPIELPFASLTILLGFILVYNTAGWYVLPRSLSPYGDAPRATLNRLQYGLTLLDQLSLTCLLGLLGGFEALVLPLLVMAAFMVSINTGKSESYWLGASLLAMVGTLFGLQYFGVIPYPSALTPLGAGSGLHPIFAAGGFGLAAAWVVLAGLVLGIVYFSNFIKDKLQRVVGDFLAGRDEITSLRRFSEDVLDRFPFAVLSLDDRGRVQAYNPAAESTLGATRTWVGQDIATLDEFVNSGLDLYLAPALKGEPLHIVNFPYLPFPTGLKRYLSITTLASDPAMREGQSIHLCMEDVGARLRREEEQRELQQALLQTEKLASLGQLAAGVAHELNNPLTAIDANAQMLQYRLRGGEAIGPESALRIERIMENSERIRVLVQNLLSYARPAPETSLALNLHTVIEEALVFCEHDLHRKQIRIERDFAAELPRVIGNKTQLQQVFVNLFTNAIQAVDAKTGWFSVRTASENGSVLIAVRDNGVGIPAPSLERIFEPFYTSRTDGSGTGLGLPIVQTIVQKHAGRIQVVSETGQGSTFFVEFPAAPTNFVNSIVSVPDPGPEDSKPPAG